MDYEGHFAEFCCEPREKKTSHNGEQCGYVGGNELSGVTSHIRSSSVLGFEKKNAAAKNPD